MAKIIHLEDSTETNRTVLVYFDSETQEYVCKLFVDNKHYEPADYFTNDYEDAIGTAKEMCKAIK